MPKAKLKTFSDLEFKPHPTGPGLMAQMNFSNGYGVSVVRFKIGLGPGHGPSRYGSYTDNELEWELAVLFNNELVYDTPITSDVVGHLSSRGVSKIMRQIQSFPSKNK